MSKCSFTDCDKQVFVTKTDRGPLCNGHYRQYNAGKVLTKLRKYMPRILPDGHSMCPVEGCDRASWHKTGYCQSHKKQGVKDGALPRHIRGYNFQNDKEC